MTGDDTFHETVLPGGQNFLWRQARPSDAPLLWEWWTAPHSVYWGVERRLAPCANPPYGPDSIKCYLQSIEWSARNGRSHIEPLIGLIADNAPSVYAELYGKKDSPLAAVRWVDDGAKGMHMLVGQITDHPRWMVLNITRDLMDWQFSVDPEMTQAVADPDVRNTAMRVLCERLGMREAGIVDMPGKKARIMTISRHEWLSARRKHT